MKSAPSILPRLFTRLVLCSLFLQTSLLSQQSAASQVVILKVAELNALSLTNNLLAVPTGQARPEIRYQASAATRLIWTSNGENRKISVKKTTAGGILTIAVEDSDGDHLFPPEGKKLTDDSTFDLVRDVSRKAGSCTIRFAAVSFDRGVDNSVQHVVYTITSS